MLDPFAGTTGKCFNPPIGKLAGIGAWQPFDPASDLRFIQTCALVRDHLQLHALGGESRHGRVAEEQRQTAEAARLEWQM